MISGILSGSSNHDKDDNEVCGIKISFNPRTDLKFSTISIFYGTTNRDENVIVQIHTGTTSVVSDVSGRNSVSNVSHVSNVQLSQMKTNSVHDGHDINMNEMSRKNDRHAAIVNNIADFDSQLHKLVMKRYSIEDNGSVSDDIDGIDDIDDKSNAAKQLAQYQREVAKHTQGVQGESDGICE